MRRLRRPTENRWVAKGCRLMTFLPLSLKYLLYACMAYLTCALSRHCVTANRCGGVPMVPFSAQHVAPHLAATESTSHDWLTGMDVIRVLIAVSLPLPRVRLHQLGYETGIEIV